LEYLENEVPLQHLNLNDSLGRLSKGSKDVCAV